MTAVTDIDHISPPSTIWRVVVLLIACLIALSSTRHANAAEYLDAEGVAPRSVSEIPSATSLFLEPDGSIEHGVLLRPLKKKFPAFAEFIDGTIVDIKPRFYYRYREIEGGSISEEAALGGTLELTSGWYRDFFRIGFAGYTSQGIYTPEGRSGTSLLRPGGESYTVLGKAYVQLKIDKLNLKFFRDELNLPYINRNDSRMTPNTFTYYGGWMVDLGDWSWAAGHITQERERSLAEFVPMSQVAGASGTDRGVSFMGVRYAPTDDLSLMVAEQYGWDTFNTAYFQGQWLLGSRGDLQLRLALQGTDQRSVGKALVGDFNTQFAGGNLILGYKSLIATLGYTWTSISGEVRSPWGGDPSFNSLMVSDFNRAGEKSYLVGLSYSFADVGIDGLSLFANWAIGDTRDDGTAASPDQREFDITADYRLEETIPGDFWLRVRAAWNNRDESQGGADSIDFRVIMNYSISF